MAVIPYADVLSSERLPIDAQDIVTRVRLVIVGSGGGAEPYRARNAIGESPTWETMSPFGAPLVYDYEAPEHATYGCTRAFALPEGFNPFLDPTDESIQDPTPTNMVDAANARDGNPATYAASTGELQSRLLYGSSIVQFAGFRLRYSLEWTGGGAIPQLNRDVMFRHVHYVPPSLDPMDPRVIASRWYSVNETEALDQPVEFHALELPDARGLEVNYDGPDLALQSSVILNVLAQHNLRVYEFYPLILNEDLLEDLARAQVRLPASLPRRVSVRGIIPPDREHTITGWPDGDLVAPVAQQQYDLGRTWIDFEQPGSPVGLPAEAIESARASLTRFRGEIQSAGYSVTMGERR